MVVENIPSPLAGQKIKVETLCPEYQKLTTAYMPTRDAIS